MRVREIVPYENRLPFTYFYDGVLLVLPLDCHLRICNWMGGKERGMKEGGGEGGGGGEGEEGIALSYFKSSHE